MNYYAYLFSFHFLTPAKLFSQQKLYDAREPNKIALIIENKTIDIYLPIRQSEILHFCNNFNKVWQFFAAIRVINSSVL